jgi:hypothetical protein
MSLYENATEFLDAGLRLIPLHQLSHGVCQCGIPDCKAGGKHPRSNKWPLQGLIDPATLDAWRTGYECNGLGWALDEDHIVLDIDSRTGGLESLEQLQADIGLDLFELCSAIVKTGGNGWHFYFKKPPERLGWKMPSKYKGIDIKQRGGFVVIPGSAHRSGVDYNWHSFAKSDLENLVAFPQQISDMLAKHYVLHHSNNARPEDAEIEEMLAVLSPDMGYEDWLKVGMAIHSATDGQGLVIWDKWSQSGTKYSDGEVNRKWHGFGRYGGDTVKIGSLVQMARSAGWEPNSASRVCTPEELAQIKENWAKTAAARVDVPSIANDADIDLHTPPGLLGKIYDYVWQCSVFPNRNLALACSLSVMSNLIGRKYYWPGRFKNIQPNLLILCIAGSSVGKDSILGAAHRLLSTANLGPAIHGRIKSDKDLLDSLERSQFAMYFNDEFGYFLQRLNNAQKKGSATYLEGIIGTIMEVFTKGDKTVLLDVSRKAEIRERFGTIIATAEKALHDGNFKDEAHQHQLQARAQRARFLINHFRDGLPNPWLSMLTTATPRTMEMAFSGESTENGFLSRAIVFQEAETNPRPRPDYSGDTSISTELAFHIKAVAFEPDDDPFGRVDAFDQDQVPITIAPDAEAFVNRAIDYFFELAETQKQNGLESLPRRALDSIVKICIMLAAQTRHLTLPMARYAVKLVRSEIETKLRRVASTENMGSRVLEENVSAVEAKIMEVCDTETGQSGSFILRQCRNSRLNKESINGILDGMVKAGQLERVDGRPYNGQPTFKYKTKPSV